MRENSDDFVERLLGLPEGYCGICGERHGARPVVLHRYTDGTTGRVHAECLEGSAYQNDREEGRAVVAVAAALQKLHVPTMTDLHVTLASVASVECANPVAKNASYSLLGEIVGNLQAQVVGIVALVPAATFSQADVTTLRSLADYHRLAGHDEGVRGDLWNLANRIEGLLPSPSGNPSVENLVSLYPPAKHRGET
jgi:hypothetical protein